MGNTLSEHNFTVNALDTTVVQDHFLLSNDEEKLFTEGFPDIYARALCFGVLHRKEDKKVYDKMKSRRSKLNDISHIFSSVNITNAKSSSADSIQTKTLIRMTDFELKCIKYHQREITFLTNNVDPYHHLIDARYQMLKRYFLAKVRNKKRHEIAGNVSTYDGRIDIKKHFICHFFGRNDYYLEYKEKELKKAKEETVTDDSKKSDKKSSIKKSILSSLKRKRKKKSSTDDVIDEEPKILTLKSPENTKHYPCTDKMLERLLKMADILPSELDVLLDFGSTLESKRRAEFEKLMPKVLKTEVDQPSIADTYASNATDDRARSHIRHLRRIQLRAERRAAQDRRNSRPIQSIHTDNTDVNESTPPLNAIPVPPVVSGSNESPVLNVASDNSMSPFGFGSGSGMSDVFQRMVNRHAVQDAVNANENVIADDDLPMIDSIIDSQQLEDNEEHVAHESMNLYYNQQQQPAYVSGGLSGGVNIGGRGRGYDGGSGGGNQAYGGGGYNYGLYQPQYNDPELQQALDASRQQAQDREEREVHLLMEVSNEAAVMQSVATVEEAAAVNADVNEEEVDVDVPVVSEPVVNEDVVDVPVVNEEVVDIPVVNEPVVNEEVVEPVVNDVVVPVVTEAVVVPEVVEAVVVADVDDNTAAIPSSSPFTGIQNALSSVFNTTLNITSSANDSSSSESTIPPPTDNTQTSTNANISSLAQRIASQLLSSNIQLNDEDDDVQQLEHLDNELQDRIQQIVTDVTEDDILNTPELVQQLQNDVHQQMHDRLLQESANLQMQMDESEERLMEIIEEQQIAQQRVEADHADGNSTVEERDQAIVVVRERFENLVEDQRQVLEDQETQRLLIRRQERLLRLHIAQSEANAGNNDGNADDSGLIYIEQQRQQTNPMETYSGYQIPADFSRNNAFASSNAPPHSFQAFLESEHAEYQLSSAQSDTQGIAHLWRQQIGHPQAHQNPYRRGGYGYHFGRGRGRGRGSRNYGYGDDWRQPSLSHRLQQRQQVRDMSIDDLFHGSARMRVDDDGKNEDEEKVEEKDDSFQSHELLAFLLERCTEDVKHVCHRAQEIHNENVQLKEERLRLKDEEEQKENDAKQFEERQKSKNKRPADDDTTDDATADVAKEKEPEKEEIVEYINPVPVASPMTQFLKIIQRDLIIKAVSREEQHKDIISLVAYLQKLLSCTTNILQNFIRPIFEECTKECLSIIENSFISHSFLPLMTEFCGLVYTPLFAHVPNKIWKDLITLLNLLDNICTLDDNLSLCVSNITQMLNAENMCIVESSHSYPANVVDEKRVCIPGATHLCLTFDSRCYTERGRDTLDIYRPDNNVPICPELHGPSRSWPKTSLVVPGHELIFRFRSEANHSNRNWWGYACTVVGLKLGLAKDTTPKSFLFLDLIHTCAHLVGKCLRVVMVGSEPNELEIKHSKWLQSPLFSKGRELPELDKYDNDDGKLVTIASFTPDDENDGKDENKDEPVVADVSLSPQWSPLVKHHSFLQDLSQLKPNSKAVAFADSMFAQCKKTMFDKMGGPIVDQTIIYFIAAFLKHLGLVEIARKYSCIDMNDTSGTPVKLKSQWNNKLLYVFKKGKILREWIISEKSRYLQEHSSTVTEAKEKEQELTAEQIQESSKYTTYEGICSEILRKTQFLLEMKPYTNMYLEGITDEDTPDFSLAMQVAKLKSLERQVSERDIMLDNGVPPLNSRSSSSASSDTWKLAFDTWQTVNTFMANKTALKNSRNQLSSLPDLIITFVQCSTTLDTFLQLIKRHRKRAHSRSNAMQNLLTLCKDLKSISPLITILREWKCPLREFGDYDNGPRTLHFLSNIQSCGIHLELQVRQNWEKLYLHFAKLINSDIHLSLKQQLISAWAIVLTPGEETFLASTKIIDTIHDMLKHHVLLLKSNWDETETVDSDGINWAKLSPTERDENDRLLKSLYSLLSIMLMRFSSNTDNKHSKMPTPNDLNLSGLQLQILKSIHVEVSEYIQRFRKLPQMAHEYAKERIIRQEQIRSENEDLFIDVRFLSTSYDHTFMQIEDILYRQVSNIRQLTYDHFNDSVRSYVLSVEFVQTLFELLFVGSARIQRVTLIILRDLMPFLEPEKISKIPAVDILMGKEILDTSENTSDRMDVSTNASLIHYLFTKVGELMLAEGVNIKSQFISEWSALDHTMKLSAEIERNLALDYVMFLRSLLDDPKWKHHVLEILFVTLKSAPSVLDLENGRVCCIANDEIKADDDGGMVDFQNVQQLICALSILGGHSERLRPGSRITLKISEEDDAAMAERGICVSVNRSSGLCQVLFDNVKRPVTIEMSKITSESEISPLNCVPISEELIHFFDIYTEPIHFDSRDPKKNGSAVSKDKTVDKTVDKSSDPVAVEVQSDEELVPPEPEEVAVTPEPAQWACGACTYINAMSRPACEICQSPNPTPVRSSGFGGQSSAAVAKEKATEVVEVEIPDAIEEPSIYQILFHQIRSLGLKALCILLQQPQGTSILLKSSKSHQLLCNLLEIAIRPTDLDQYRSVRFLEEQEDRLLEKLHDRPLLLDERVPKSVREQTQKQLLKYSPFRNLAMNLPMILDIESAMNVQFIHNHAHRIRFYSDSSYFGGYCRSSNLIPQTLQNYYFEVTIVSIGNGRRRRSVTTETDTEQVPATDDWNIAAGFWRSGMSFEGNPGYNNSYAIAVNGNQYSTVARESIPTELQGLTFKEGDTIGIGIDGKQYQSIYFTRNGSLLSMSIYRTVGFDNVQGQFYPMVWLQSDRCCVEVNLGQTPFLYDFESKIDPIWLKNMESNQKQLTGPELARQTMAEELVIMMGNFPLELAVIALEQCNDNLQNAAMWLLSNAESQLEQFYQNALERTREQDADQNENKDNDGKDDDDDEDILDANGRINLQLWLTADLDDPQSGGGNERRGANNAGALLDDEIDAQLPVGLTTEELLGTARRQFRREREEEEAALQAYARRHRERDDEDDSRAHNSMQIGIGNRLRQQLPPLKLHELHSGQKLSVWTDADRICHGFWPKLWNRLRGKTGVVYKTDVNKKIIDMEFPDAELGIFHRCSLPIRALHKPIETYNDPLKELNVRTPEVIEGIKSNQGLRSTDIRKEVPIFGYASHFLEIEHALSILKVRRSVVWLIRNWPADKKFDFKLFGGIDTMMRLILLAGAEALSAGTSRSKLLVKNKNNMMNEFGNVFSLLKNEEKQYLSSLMSDEQNANAVDTEDEFECKLRFVDDIFDKKWKKKNPKRTDLLNVSTDVTSLTQALIEECVLHFVQSVNNPSLVLQFQSKHLPYTEHADIRLLVQVPGASRLLVTFDAQCAFANDMMTSLRFYADQEFQDQIVCCRRTGAEHFPTFIVPSNRFWFKFSTSGDSRHWGYRFYVKPIEKHIDDKQALDSLNFELGSWLFELLVNYKHILRLDIFAESLYDAVSYFVLNLKSSGKAKGIEQLIQLLLEIHKMEVKPHLNLNRLKGLGSQMDDVVDKMVASNSTVQSQLLNSVVELMAITELFHAPQLKARVSNVDNSEVPANNAPAVETTVIIDSESSVTAGGPSWSKKKSSKKKNKGKPKNKPIVIQAAAIDKYFSAREIYISRIHILNAEWIYNNKTGQKLDITKAMQDYVNRLGGTRLNLPPRTKWNHPQYQRIFSLVSINHRGIGEANEQECKIDYQLVRDVYDPVIDDMRRDIIKTRSLHIAENIDIRVMAAPTTFDRVVEMSSLTLSLISKNTKNQLPPLFLGEAARASHICESFYPLCDHARCLKTDETRLECGIPCPTGGVFAIREFSILFWIWLGAKRFRATTDGDRNVIRKGDRHSTCVLPHIYFPAGAANNLQIDVSCVASKITIASATQLKTNQWHHIAVTADCIGVKLFINGKLDNKVRVNSPLVENHDPFYISKVPYNVGQIHSATAKKYGFKGMLLDCRYYLRRLDDKSISQYFSKCKPRSVKHGKSDGEWMINFTTTNVNKSSSDPTKRTQISLSMLRDHCNRKVPAFNPNLWSPSKNNELMELWENMFSAYANDDLTNYWLEPQQNARTAVPAGCTQLHIQPYSLKLSDTLLERHHLLQHMSKSVLKKRYYMLRMLNFKMKKVFPLVDFSQVGLSWSLASRLCQLRGLIFADLKREPWRQVLDSTTAHGRTSVIVNRPKALRAAERGDQTGKKSIFGQIYRCLNFVKPAELRCAIGSRPWSISFEGEGGTDAGGLFRESISALCEDLQSDHISLFIKCQNSSGFGDNQEKWLPNPTANSSLHLSMFTFIGKLMGVAIRGRFYLNLDIPSIVWKPLVGIKAVRSDLLEIDTLCHNMLERMSNSTNITEETFADVINCHFAITSSDGRTVPLKPDGENILVTWQNRHEYVALYEKYRLNEFDTQIDAIRRGLATIVPISLLPLFTWRQLELMVCGRREIDIDLLKANTVYKHGVRKDDPHIQFFWQVLKEFTHPQRQNFLRFVWGQSRLPTRSEDFAEPFGILSSRVNNDIILPVSHTCFFTMELPKYSTKEIMKKKILYAISNCYAIDTDFVAQRNDAWQQE